MTDLRCAATRPNRLIAVGACLLGCAALASFAANSAKTADAIARADQSALPVTLNDGDNPLQFDWPALHIGTGEYQDGPTGVTVIHFQKRSLVAVDVRGGAPGTVNTDYVRLGYETPELDAIVFSGGSAYGLESITAVGSALKDDGLRDSNFNNVAISVGAIIYDFGDRRLNEIYPDTRLAQATFRAARPGVIALGAHGAGRMAMSGGIFGCHAHSGQGAAFRQIGPVKIAAFVVVNSVGAIVTRDGKLAACNRDPTWPADISPKDLLASMSAGVANPPQAPDAPKRNTTISLIVTNKRMAPADLQRLAVQVHTSMARAIQPFATRFDGDVLYAVSTAEYEPPQEEAVVGNVLLDIAASELMWDAVLTSIPEQPAAPQFATGAPSTTPAQLTRYAGEYVFSPIARLRISTDGTHLFAQATGSRPVFAVNRGAKVPLQALSTSEFGLPGRYPFVVSFAAAGKVILDPGPWQQTGIRQPK